MNRSARSSSQRVTVSKGPFPDIACADIIDREILPRFQKNDYYGGLDAGTDILMSLASGEYNYEIQTGVRKQVIGSCSYYHFS